MAGLAISQSLNQQLIAGSLTGIAEHYGVQVCQASNDSRRSDNKFPVISDVRDLPPGGLQHISDASPLLGVTINPEFAGALNKLIGNGAVDAYLDELQHSLAKQFPGIAHDGVIIKKSANFSILIRNAEKYGLTPQKLQEIFQKIIASPQFNRVSLKDLGELKKENPKLYAEIARESLASGANYVSMSRLLSNRSAEDLVRIQIDDIAQGGDLEAVMKAAIEKTKTAKGIVVTPEQIGVAPSTLEHIQETHLPEELMLANPTMDTAQKEAMRYFLDNIATLPPKQFSAQIAKSPLPEPLKNLFIQQNLIPFTKMRFNETGGVMYTAEGYAKEAAYLPADRAIVLQFDLKGINASNKAVGEHNTDMVNYKELLSVIEQRIRNNPELKAMGLSDSIKAITGGDEGRIHLVTDRVLTTEEKAKAGEIL